MTEVLTNSRFITHPSTVEKSTNHTVVLVDATEQDITNIALLCKVANKNYDIYLYEDNGDLEWLAHVSGLSDEVVIKEMSGVDVTRAHRIDNMVTYFQEFDKI